MVRLSYYSECARQSVICCICNCLSNVSGFWFFTCTNHSFSLNVVCNFFRLSLQQGKKLCFHRWFLAWTIHLTPPKLHQITFCFLGSGSQVHHSALALHRPVCCLKRGQELRFPAMPSGLSGARMPLTDAKLRQPPSTT